MGFDFVVDENIFVAPPSPLALIPSKTLCNPYLKSHTKQVQHVLWFTPTASKSPVALYVTEKRPVFEQFKQDYNKLEKKIEKKKWHQTNNCSFIKKKSLQTTDDRRRSFTFFKYNVFGCVYILLLFWSSSVSPLQKNGTKPKQWSQNVVLINVYYVSLSLSLFELKIGLIFSFLLLLKINDVLWVRKVFFSFEANRLLFIF